MTTPISIYQCFLKYDFDPDMLTDIEEVAQKVPTSRREQEIEFDSIKIVFKPDGLAMVCDLYSDEIVTIETAELFRDLRLHSN